MKTALLAMQQANYRVVLDACVLVPPCLCDLFLRLAETPRQYVPVWSQEILDETCRNKRDALEWPQELCDYFRDKVTEAFPEALAGDYSALLPSLANNWKDKHVLAAAIHEKAELIVTFNLKHFPAAALKPFNVEAKHPQDYLLNLYSINPVAVVDRLSAMAEGRKFQGDIGLLLAQLHKTVPKFIEHLRQEGI
jgi:hypothetical protein